MDYAGCPEIVLIRINTQELKQSCRFPYLHISIQGLSVARGIRRRAAQRDQLRLCVTNPTPGFDQSHQDLGCRQLRYIRCSTRHRSSKSCMLRALLANVAKYIVYFWTVQFFFSFFFPANGFSILRNARYHVGEVAF